MKPVASSKFSALFARTFGRIAPLLAVVALTPACFFGPGEDFEGTDSQEEETEEAEFVSPADSDFFFGDLQQLSLHGGSGGTLSHDACTPGDVLIGLSGFLDEAGRHGQMQAKCARLEVEQANDGSFLVSTGESDYTPLLGAKGQAAWSSQCPQNEVVIGFAVRTGQLVDQVQLSCAPLELIDGGNEGLFLMRGEAHDLKAVGANSGSAFVERCPEGTVATVLDLRSGDSIDALGMSCRSLELAE
jgi:hypothetical protein